MTVENRLDNIDSVSLQEAILANLPLSAQRKRVSPYLEELVRRAESGSVVIQQTYESLVRWYEIMRKNPERDYICNCGTVAVTSFLKDELNIDILDLNPSERWRAEHIDCCDCEESPDVPSLKELVDSYGQTPEKSRIISQE